MPNDAKLGLLAGVLGVIIAATISGKAPTSLGTAGNAPPTNSQQPAPASKMQAKASDATTPALLPAELPTTPVIQTRPEVEATTASRTSRKDKE